MPEEEITDNEIDAALGTIADPTEDENESVPDEEEQVAAEEEEVVVAGSQQAPTAEEIARQLLDQASRVVTDADPGDEQPELNTVEDVAAYVIKKTTEHQRVVGNVHAEVEEVFAKASEHAVIGDDLKAEVRKVLANADPSVYRMGLGSELANYAIGKALIEGRIKAVTSAKVVTKPAGSGMGKGIASPTQGTQPKASKEEEEFMRCFGEAYEDKNEIKKVFNN